MTDVRTWEGEHGERSSRERQAFLTFNKITKILPKIIGTRKRHACPLLNVKTITTRRTKNDGLFLLGEECEQPKTGNQEIVSKADKPRNSSVRTMDTQK